MRKITFVITLHDKEKWWDHLVKIIKSYDKIDAKIITVYTGDRPDQECDLRMPNRGHGNGHYFPIYEGYKLAKSCLWSNEILFLAADSWFLDQDILLGVFDKMIENKACYGGNHWYTNGTFHPSLSTDIFFANLTYGDPYMTWELHERDIESSLYAHMVERLKMTNFYIIPERTPIEWENRYKCLAMKGTFEHDLELNLARAREWGYKG